MIKGVLIIMTSLIGSKFPKDSKVELLDVRTEQEWNEKHIEGSKLIDFKDPSFRSKVSELDKGKSYEVYCRSGNRSESAVKIMNEIGFKSVINVGSVEEALVRSKGKCVGKGC